MTYFYNFKAFNSCFLRLLCVLRFEYVKKNISVERLLPLKMATNLFLKQNYLLWKKVSLLKRNNK